MDPQKKSICIFHIKNRVLSLFENIGLHYLGRSYGWSKSINYFLVILMWKTPIHLGSVKIILGLPVYMPGFFRASPKTSYRPANTSSFYLQYLLHITSCAIFSELLYILHHESIL